MYVCMYVCMYICMHLCIVYTWLVCIYRVGSGRNIFRPVRPGPLSHKLWRDWRTRLNVSECVPDFSSVVVRKCIRNRYGIPQDMSGQRSYQEICKET